MSARTRSASGFTLVEILIVVVILGILAAIVIPQFTNASDSAKGSSLTSQLQTIRSQLELAQTQHLGTYPDVSGSGWTPMTGKTSGVAAYTASTATNAFGPYLQQAPNNPFESSTSVAAAAASGVGWVYTSSNGAIKGVMSATKAASLYGSSSAVPTNDIATY